MELMDIIRSRHSVRQYEDRKIGESLRKEINAFIAGLNRESGLNMQVFYDEPRCFRSFLAHYGRFENVTDYIVVAGTKKDEEKAGYYGEKLVLKCQELGLNTCWVALTHGKTQASLEKGQKVLIIIALGYGRTQGVPHKGKPVEALMRADRDEPWFREGMEAVSLAPTAINQQKFLFELKDGAVTARSLGGPYSAVDLGIVKYHFEAVTGHKVK